MKKHFKGKAMTGLGSLLAVVMLSMVSLFSVLVPVSVQAAGSVTVNASMSQAEIQAAISDTQYDTVVFKAGTYTDMGFNLTHSVHITTEASDAGDAVVFNNSTSVISFDIASGTSSTISTATGVPMIINGNSNAIAIRVTVGSELQLQNADITVNDANVGLWFYDKTTINNSAFTTNNAKSAIRSYSAAKLSIINNSEIIANNNQHVGIQLINPNDITISDSTITIDTSVGTGMVFDSSNKNAALVIDNATINVAKSSTGDGSNGHGITIAIPLTITNTTITSTGNKGAGINFTAPGAVAANATPVNLESVTINTSDNAYGIYLGTNASIYQSGGSITMKNDGTGLWLRQGSFTMTGGNNYVKAKTTDVTNFNLPISGTFTITGGSFYVEHPAQASFFKNAAPNSERVYQFALPLNAAADIMFSTKGVNQSYEYAAPDNGDGNAYVWVPKATYKFNKNDGSSTPPQSLDLIRGQSADFLGLAPTTPSRTNYYFGGWFTGADGTGTQYSQTAAAQADTTYYAKWLLEPADLVAVAKIINTDYASAAYVALQAIEHGFAYQTDIVLPDDVSGYTSLQFTEQVADCIIIDDVEVTVDGQSILADGILDTTGNLVSFTLDANYNYGNLAGKTVSVYVHGHIGDHSGARARINREIVSDATVVVSGYKTFIANEVILQVPEAAAEEESSGNNAGSDNNNQNLPVTGQQNITLLVGGMLIVSAGALFLGKKYTDK